ncbi:MAG TPA: S9 family peptidase [Candidatus Krumholzibacteriaceae bacterium]|nr:S9 family peptidase [Candidatus Krumholzibacteriaceae bacterium]
MKKLTTLLSAVLLLAVSVSAADLTYLDQLPPLIERDVLFGDPEIAGAKISPDGEYISFLKPHNDVLNIWVKEFHQPFEKARPVTADTTRPVRSYFWTKDSKYILYIQDKGGNENFHIYAVDPAGKPASNTSVPEARDLTPVDSVTTRIYSLPEDKPNIIYIGLNERDQRYHDIYRLNIDTGKRELVRENKEKIAGWVFDQDDNLRLAVRQTDDGGSEIFRVDGKNLTSIYKCTNEEQAGPVAFHENGEWFYMSTNKGEDINLSRLVLFNPETLEEKLVESDPEGQADFGGTIFSDKTDELIATYYVGDRLRIYWKDFKFKWAYKRLKHKLPDGDIYMGSSTKDERYWIVATTSDTDPGARYLYDMERGKVEFLYRGRPDLPVEYLAPMEPVCYKSRDGLSIHGYLTTPRNVEAKDLALVVNPHGGPWARDHWGYNPYAQFLANRGYAVLQMNFRGSTGYGKAFFNAAKEEWGDAMQNDITDGVNYLVDKGIVDPDKVAIFGGSYGGYATLAGLAFTPDLYAAGVDYVGVSNIITLLKTIPPYWETARAFFNEHVGDPDDPEDVKRLRRQSPLFSAEKIKAPLLVVQGANDPRVKKAESDQIVVAMRELGRDVEYIVAPDEGHGFAGEENRMAFTVAMEKFLAKHLGGRFQKSVAPEISEKLEAITVPVDSVSMPEISKGYESAKSAALPDVEPEIISAMDLKYRITASVAGNDIELSAERKIEESKADKTPVWLITTTQKSPMGNAMDKVTLRRDNLLPVSSEVNQGPAKIILNYTEDAISGNINMRGNDIPVDIELEAPVFGPSSAVEIALTALPLAEGYKTTYRVFDIMSQKVKVYSLEVTGTEKVILPAGEFKAFKLISKPMDDEPGGGTYFISSKKEGRCVLKSILQLPPQYGGGTATTELMEIK